MAQQWATLRDAVAWIRGAGGLAVIAHPARYKYSANEEWALFEEFKAHGGRGVEVLTGEPHAGRRQRVRRHGARVRVARVARQRLP